MHCIVDLFHLTCEAMSCELNMAAVFAHRCSCTWKARVCALQSLGTAAPDKSLHVEQQPVANQATDGLMPWLSCAAGDAEPQYVAPVGELEAQLQATWQDVLGQENVSTQADFFAIGGNSLQVTFHASSIHVPQLRLV